MRMTDQPHYPETADDAEVDPDQDSNEGTPRGVIVIAIVVVVVVVLLLIVLHLSGGIGPALHS